MASLMRYDGGLHRIDFQESSSGRRVTIRLGRLPVKAAQAIAAKVTAMIADRRTNRPHDAEVLDWITRLDPRLQQRLAKAGLIAESVGAARIILGEMLERI